MPSEVPKVKTLHVFPFQLFLKFSVRQGLFFKESYFGAADWNIYWENGKMTEVVVEAGGWLHGYSLYYFWCLYGFENFIIKSYKKILCGMLIFC